MECIVRKREQHHAIHSYQTFSFIIVSLQVSLSMFVLLEKKNIPPIGLKTIL